MDHNHVTAPTMLIKGAEVWREGAFRPMDVLIEGGVIARISPSIAPEDGVEVIDASGCHLLPGLVDLHVHLREPGYSYKETIATGTAAAARGGFTTVCAMPNVNPVPDSADTLAAQEAIIRRDAIVEVLPYASITLKRLGKDLTDHSALAGRVAGFSDDGTGVQDDDVMRRSMTSVARTGKMLAAHCEVDSLLRKGYIHDGAYAAAHGHRGICSRSEWEEVERDIRLAEETGCRLHVCHISTAESVEAVRRGKARGVKVTCETAPHYLAFCDSDLKEDGRFKMNPPLRSASDRQALLEGIKDGTIDAIATDHAPHSAEEKSRGLEKSAMGVVGLETSLGASYTYTVAKGLISLERLVELMSVTPRRLLGKDTAPIAEGKRADMTLVDFRREWKVDPVSFLSKGRSTPFEGMTLKGNVLMTIADGKLVWEKGEAKTD